ncbi:unnamed protein product, partial [marine sediment metagenome]
LLFAIAALAVSCSSDDGDSDELSFEDWQSRVSDVCDEYEPKADAIEAEHGEPADRSALDALIVDYIAYNEEYMDALLVVGVPGERADEVETLYADLQASEDGAIKALAAVRSGDEAAFEVLSADIAERSENLNEQAQEMGVPACDSRARVSQET